MTHRDADAAREWANVLGKRLRAARKRRGYGLCIKMEYAEAEGLLRVLQAAAHPDRAQLAEALPAAPECPACGSSMTFACNDAGCAYSIPATAQPAEVCATADAASAHRAWLTICEPDWLQVCDWIAGHDVLPRSTGSFMSARLSTAGLLRALRTVTVRPVDEVRAEVAESFWRCGSCRGYRDGECRNVGSLCIGNRVSENWGCGDWQPKGGGDE